jgi:hypothetical protein
MNTAPPETSASAFFSPESHPGLRENDFRKICVNGFGDGYNAYAYSMQWFGEHLFVGTGRANLHLLKIAMPFVRIDMWPVECLHRNYSPEFEREAARGEIWCYHPATAVWSRVYHSPLVKDAEGVEFSRDLGYRAMAVFQGASDTTLTLYVATWSRSRGNGPDLLRSGDGRNFDVLPKAKFRRHGRETKFNAIRALTVFKGKLYTAPTGATRGNVNASGVSLIYATDDPTTGNWRCVNEPGFGELPEVMTVFELAVAGDYLYAGTAGLRGFQIWRTQGGDQFPHCWEKVLDGGAGRGGLNQGAASMIGFRDALYIGTGIQNGGYDWRNNIGPAAAEIIRLNADATWDIIVGNARDGKEPLSGLNAGFNNYFSGYLWRMASYEGWLYAGTMDWSTILKFTNLEKKSSIAARMIAEAGVDDFVKSRGGFELWRSSDGENWLPATRRGFGNFYNYGCRTIAPTPHGLFIGTANPFGPRVARREGKGWNWVYEDNPLGGLEIWLANSAA